MAVSRFSKNLVGVIDRADTVEDPARPRRLGVTREVAAIKVLEGGRPDARVATVLCDNHARYLSTALAQEESMRSDYLSQHVELLGWRAL